MGLYEALKKIEYILPEYICPGVNLEKKSNGYFILNVRFLKEKGFDHRKINKKKAFLQFTGGFLRGVKEHPSFYLERKVDEIIFNYLGFVKKIKIRNIDIELSKILKEEKNL